MDYKELASDLLSGCEENCADCGYAGDSEFECTIAQLGATAITELLSENDSLRNDVDLLKGRADAAEKEVERLRESLDFARTKDAEIVRMGRALSEAGERVEKAEKCISEIEDALKFGRYSAAVLRIFEYRGQKEE